MSRLWFSKISILEILKLNSLEAYLSMIISGKKNYICACHSSWVISSGRSSLWWEPSQRKSVLTKSEQSVLQCRLTPHHSSAKGPSNSSREVLKVSVPSPILELIKIWWILWPNTSGRLPVFLLPSGAYAVTSIFIKDVSWCTLLSALLLDFIYHLHR